MTLLALENYRTGLFAIMCFLKHMIFLCIFLLLLAFAQVRSDNDCEVLKESKQNLTICNEELLRLGDEHKALLLLTAIKDGKQYCHIGIELTQPISAQCTNLTDWSICSATCGIGTRTRSKECELLIFGQQSKKLTVSEFEECTTDCSSKLNTSNCIHW